MSSPYVAGNGLPANKLTYQLDCQVKSGDLKVELIDGTLRPVNSTLYLIHNFQIPSPTSYTNIPGVDGIIETANNLHSIRGEGWYGAQDGDPAGARAPAWGVGRAQGRPQCALLGASRAQACPWARAGPPCPRSQHFCISCHFLNVLNVNLFHFTPFI